MLLWERGADHIENTGSRVVTVLFPSHRRFFREHTNRIGARIAHMSGRLQLAWLNNQFSFICLSI
jgi:hypothetical protein